MFERHQTGESAILVQVQLGKNYISNDMYELEQLVKSANLHVFGHLEIKRNKPHPRYYIGQGKVEELAELVNKLQASVIIFNNPLSPSQERDLEKICQCRVLDRTTLILDIFAQRARTHEGKLQVELAQLNYLSTRLVRGWTHLERQRGGVGLRGPGEKQLETDKRLLRKRIHALLNKLKLVEAQRYQTRRNRKKSELPIVSLIGYTNAGKSTLFNQATCSNVYAENTLFATLDPTFRRFNLMPNQSCILADTVGLIKNLPHELIESFNATLQESRDADLLLHVVDASDSMHNINIDTVNSVIESIGASTVPTIFVYNKIDLLEDSTSKIEYDNHGLPIRVWLASKHKEDMNILKQAVVEKLQYQVSLMEFYFPPEFCYFRSFLYQCAEVASHEIDVQGGCRMCVRISRRGWDSLLNETNGLVEKFIEFSDTIN